MSNNARITFGNNGLPNAANGSAIGVCRVSSTGCYYVAGVDCTEPQFFDVRRCMNMIELAQTITKKRWVVATCMELTMLGFVPQFAVSVTHMRDRRSGLAGLDYTIREAEHTGYAIGSAFLALLHYMNLNVMMIHSFMEMVLWSKNLFDITTPRVVVAPLTQQGIIHQLRDEIGAVLYPRLDKYKEIMKPEVTPGLYVQSVDGQHLRPFVDNDDLQWEKTRDLVLLHVTHGTGPNSELGRLVSDAALKMASTNADTRDLLTHAVAQPSEAEVKLAAEELHEGDSDDAGGDDAYVVPPDSFSPASFTLNWSAEAGRIVNFGEVTSVEFKYPPDVWTRYRPAPTESAAMVLNNLSGFGVDTQWTFQQIQDGPVFTACCLCTYTTNVSGSIIQPTPIDVVLRVTGTGHGKAAAKLRVAVSILRRLLFGRDSNPRRLHS
jgi:hypothetical protein